MEHDSTLGVLEADTEEDHQGPLDVLERIVGQELTKMAGTRMPYDRILVVGMLPDEKGETSWSGVSAIELCTLIIYAVRAFYDHLEPDFNLDTFHDALITEINKHRDSIKEKTDNGDHT